MAAGTTILMIRALDGLAQRATITAQNVANAGTPNYRPLRLRFEEALRRAAAAGDDAVAAVRPSIERIPLGAPEARGRIDLELATVSTTALRYSALVGLLGRELQFETLAITGNG